MFYEYNYKIHFSVRQILNKSVIATFIPAILNKILRTEWKKLHYKDLKEKFRVLKKNKPTAHTVFIGV